MAQAAVSRIVPVKEILDKYRKSDIIMVVSRQTNRLRKEDDYDEETYKYWSRVCHVYGLDECVSGSGSRRGGPPGGE